MGGTQQLARLAGGLVGLGIVFAAASPLSGVSPQRGSELLAPATVEVRTQRSGELEVNPFGVALPATAIPSPGESGGPLVSVKLTSQTGLPVAISVRLVPIAPDLDAAGEIRGSVAGGVVFDGPLAATDEWSQPVGQLNPGESTTLRLRIRLKAGADPNTWRGRADVRQLEVKGVPLS